MSPPEACQEKFAAKDGHLCKCDLMKGHQWRHIHFPSGATYIKESHQDFEKRIRRSEASLILSEVHNAINASSEEEPNDRIGTIVNMVDEIQKRRVG